MGIRARAARELDVPVEGDDIKKVRDGSSGRAYRRQPLRAPLCARRPPDYESIT